MRTPACRKACSGLARECGAELVEMAFVLPLLLSLLIGLFSLGRAYNTYQTITRGAREGARMAVVTTCATCGNSSYTAAQVRTQFVEPVLTAANLDPTKIQNYSQNTQWLDPTGTPPQQCGIVISFKYPYQLTVPFTSVNLTNITLGTSVQMRLENQGSTCP